MASSLAALHRPMSDLLIQTPAPATLLSDKKHPPNAPTSSVNAFHSASRPNPSLRGRYFEYPTHEAQKIKMNTTTGVAEFKPLSKATPLSTISFPLTVRCASCLVNRFFSSSTTVWRLKSHSQPHRFHGNSCPYTRLPCDHLRGLRSEFQNSSPLIQVRR